MARKNRIPSIVHRFDKYFGDGDLEDWQRLCRDVGLEEHYSSKTKCRKALRTVHVNIFDLLSAIEGGYPVQRFRNTSELARYTVDSGKIYPRRYIKEMGPVKALLRQVL